MSDPCILFPGQGSQEKGMGRDLAEARDEARDLWLLAEKESGLPLRGIYWEGAEADMAETSALQPALTVVNLSLWLAARGRLRPAATAGHSLGEFAALAAAGVLSVEDVVRAVVLRGKLMSQAGAEGHGMAAVVKLPQAEVESVTAQALADTGRELRIANYNSPAQFVLSGEKPALDRAAELVKERKGRAIPLAVSGAFHSPLMAEAAAAFAKLLDGLHWRAPQLAVYHNATARPEPSAEGAKKAVTAQMTSSVLWVQTMNNLKDAGCRRFLELGPKGVLSKLAKANLEGVEGLEIGAAATLAEVEALPA
ncbi:ACP S-malonyltransferase [Desulfovibrio sp.]